MCTIPDFSRLVLTEACGEMLRTELAVWHKAYLPVGRTVLDLGAGCGETAQFYLNHGAEKVICIEPNPECLRLLHQNFDGDDRIHIVNAKIDSIKCDIEGSEKDMVIETHFPVYLERQFTFSGKFAQVSLWKLKKMENLDTVMSNVGNLVDRLHYARIQIAHFIRRAISSI